MELAIQTDKVVVKLFRRIDVGDVYANVKGTDEMCFGEATDLPFLTIAVFWDGTLIHTRSSRLHCSMRGKLPVITAFISSLGAHIFM